MNIGDKFRQQMDFDLAINYLKKSILIAKKVNENSLIIMEVRLFYYERDMGKG